MEEKKLKIFTSISYLLLFIVYCFFYFFEYSFYFMFICQKKYKYTLLKITITINCQNNKLKESFLIFKKKIGVTFSWNQVTSNRKPSSPFFLGFILFLSNFFHLNFEQNFWRTIFSHFFFFHQNALNNIFWKS